METRIIVGILGFLASISPNIENLENNNLKGQVLEVKEASYQGVEDSDNYQLGDKNYAGHSFINIIKTVI